MPINSPSNRRNVLHGIAGVGLASMSPSFAVAAMTAGSPTPAAPVSVDLTTPQKNLRALLKMLASTDPLEVVFNFAAGRVYACMVGRPPIPLFGTHSISVARGSPRPDGSFLLRQHIVGFRTQFDTENVIDDMTNPVTGEHVDLPLTDYGFNDSDYRLDGTFAMVKPAPRQLSALGARPWTEANGIVALSDDALLPASGPQQPKVDVVTRFATVRELADPAVTSAASWFSFSAVDPFRPWLKMREPGLQLWHVYGRKVRTPDGMPDYIRRVAADRFPTLFNLPHF